MAAVHPISDLPKIGSRFAAASKDAAWRSVGRSTLAVENVAKANGGRHYIKGYSGARVRLSATSDVAKFGANPVGKVDGVPAGFWRIVEEGSAKHLIVGRGRSGSRKGRKSSSSRDVKAFGEGATFSDRNPLRNQPTESGWAQFVQHPGHDPQGRPWARTLDQAPRAVSLTTNTESASSFVKAWKSI